MPSVDAATDEQSQNKMKLQSAALL